MKNVLMMELKMNRHINMKNYFMLLTVFIFTDFLHASISELQGNFLQQMPNFNSISFDFSYTQEIKEYGVNNKVTETSFYILGELKAFLNSLDYFYRATALAYKIITALARQTVRLLTHLSYIVRT